MDEIKQYLQNVYGVVEATSYERYSLWKNFSINMEWEQELHGYGVTVGHVHPNRPVCISIQMQRIDGKKILFIEPTSVVVDWDLIRDWLRTHLPQSAIKVNGCINIVDANNFHNIFH